MQKYLFYNINISYVNGILIIIILLLLGIAQVNAHPLYNSQTFKTGGYKIQIATDPEIPGEGDKTIIMLAVTSTDDNDLKDIILSLKITQGQEEVLTFGPQLIKDGHVNIEHVFKRSGHYIAEVNIYENDKLIDARFNIGVTKVFSSIFTSLIIVSVLSPIALLFALKYFIPKKR